MYKTHSIYKITSIINNKKYIGSAVDFNSRKSKHLSALQLNKHGNIHLQSHVNKYGIDDLQFSIVEVIMFPELLIQREQYYINTLKPEFNICKIAGNTLGVKCSDERKEKIGNANRGRIVSDETRKKLSIVGKGRVCSEETHKKLSIAQLGNASSKGIPKSEEHKRKISESNKGKKMKPESIQKMVNTRKNNGSYKPHTEEWKKNNSKLHKGNKYNLGRKATEETKQKMRKPHKKRENPPPPTEEN
jgi:group I intron endonuclease